MPFTVLASGGCALVCSKITFAALAAELQHGMECARLFGSDAPPWHTLPRELLGLILQELRGDVRKNARCVCKAWRDVLDSITTELRPQVCSLGGVGVMLVAPMLHRGRLAISRAALPVAWPQLSTGSEAMGIGLEFRGGGEPRTS